LANLPPFGGDFDPISRRQVEEAEWCHTQKFHWYWPSVKAFRNEDSKNGRNLTKWAP